MANLLITGGAGFIGSHFVQEAIRRGHKVVVLDLLTYAGHRINLTEVANQIELVVGDIADSSLVKQIVNDFKIDAIFNLAAESHVDRSIEGPAAFVNTNIMGTYVLLNEGLKYWKSLPANKASDFRYVQISTDEVYGELGPTGQFSETSPYLPNSPYSACKASGDLLVRAWHHTYKFPTLTTNCSNNYGPRQYPEKLIPFMVQCALENKPLGIYGNGKNVRDWIHVKDHCAGIFSAFEKGRTGETYCFGGNSERDNVQVVEAICQQLDLFAPRADGRPHRDSITFVKDRPGHDLRYAIDDRKAQTELGYRRQYLNFEDGLADTVKWYVDNQEWCKIVKGAKP